MLLGALHIVWVVEYLSQILPLQDDAPKVLRSPVAESHSRYTLGHCQQNQQVNSTLERSHRLYVCSYVCSNYLDGVALGDCVRCEPGTSHPREPVFV
jgi:protoporphyrinogen/coproporphyrinogen III oxidase